ncbi:geranylgeranyl reductase family protein [Nocardioides sp. HDW12B]|uniref:NAD(P)/FAD-dependent oxidoreductase n=1 Tax=Nocardioides sp. HDW12B TaxID=2714939 RepID=UPI00140D9345|nr:geranylgeranyl reductase family protein [Nocardioides sp. HDW12B]QIK65896.1 geranylgeranyl reductase family protein [Nocardioides sp. HDW12B]
MTSDALGRGVVHDLVVVGSGPAGAATALGALAVDPDLSVLLLDRADFPRDKSCGDGVAPHVLDLLAEVGVTGLLDDRVPVTRLRLRRGDLGVDRPMTRPAWVVPRRVLDARLLDAALGAGARWERRRVRDLVVGDDGVVLDGEVAGRLTVGADGAHSVVRRALGRPDGPRALAIRGYAPTPAERRGGQTIVFGDSRQPSYAWAFDCGDGTSNVGYGELLTTRRDPPTRRQLLEQLEHLLPGTTADAVDWRGHHLPLSTARPLRPAHGRVLLAGDAAGLVNPLTGEGIYYAVATGLLAGRAAAEALRDAGSDGPRARATAETAAGATYTRRVRRLLARHLRHTALAARLSLNGRVLDAGLRASARDQRVFDDLVELGLARGTLTPTLSRGLATSLLGRTPPHAHPQETPV